MLSKEGLARIVRDEVENLAKKGEMSYKFYYILLDGKIYLGDKYDKEVAEGVSSANDIYAYVRMNSYGCLDEFLFRINYVETPSIAHIVDAYLRKMGFTFYYFSILPPTPNLKYFIIADIKDNNTEPEYLGVDIYDIDSLARSFRIPQIVEQKLGNKPREITRDELSDIYDIVIEKQPILAGHTYDDVWHILDHYFVLHEEEHKEEAYKIALAYLQLFPKPYEVCYEWGAGIFIKTDCVKLVLRSFSS